MAVKKTNPDDPDHGQTTDVVTAPKVMTGLSKHSLILLVGPPELVGKVWSIDKVSVSLGRYATSEIHVADSSISKIHARFNIVDTRLTVTDLGATNGTFVNGKKLATYKAYPLRSGDQIRTGKVVIKYHEK